jgi:CRP/FNR family transcriptional regulator, anaerobic regulatory protein
MRMDGTSIATACALPVTPRMRVEETNRLISVYPALGDLPPDLKARLCEDVRPLRAEAGRLMFDPTDACEALPLLTGGAVRVVKPLPTGKIVPLYRLTPGEFCVLSVSCLLANMRYPARGSAIEDVTGFVLPKAFFRTLIDRQPTFRNAVFGVFAARLTALMALIEQIAVSRLDQRLAELLLARGPAVRATHQALADELGTAREVVSRILEHFEADGLVQLHRAHVEVDGTRLTRMLRSSP